MKAFHKQRLNRFRSFDGGDTIVEVLIAIAVAAFAIGTSYSIANKSLQRAITARERNEAINIIQNQISDLKVRYHAYKAGDPAFTNGFALPAGSGLNTRHDFCLDDNATSQGDVAWPRFDNNISNDSQLNTLVIGSPGYNAKCRIPTTSTDYYVDIAAIVTSSSLNAKDPTVYKVSVRWAEVGTGAVGGSTVYYRF